MSIYSVSAYLIVGPELPLQSFLIKLHSVPLTRSKRLMSESERLVTEISIFFFKLVSVEDAVVAAEVAVVAFVCCSLVLENEPRRSDSSPPLELTCGCCCCCSVLALRTLFSKWVRSLASQLPSMLGLKYCRLTRRCTVADDEESGISFALLVCKFFFFFCFRKK